MYLVGGTSTPQDTTASKSLFSLDLGLMGSTWKELAPLPGPGRILPVAASRGGSLYIFSGAGLAPDAQGNPVRTYLNDAWRYHPERGWEALATMPRAAVAAPSPAPASGASQLLIIGGDDGTLSNFEPKSEHPGFTREILAYDTLTNTWGGWTEPNASVEHGSPEHNQAVADHQCLIGSYETNLVLLFERCDGGGGLNPADIAGRAPGIGGGGIDPDASP